MRTFAILWSCLALVAVADEPVLSLVLKGNRTVRGKLIAVTGGAVTIETAEGRQSVPADELGPAAAESISKRLEERLAGKDAPSQVDLGEFCLRHGLYARARAAYQAAEKHDDSFVTRTLSEQGLRECDRLEARELYQQAVDLHTQGKVEPARKALQALLARFGESSFADPARKLLDLLPPPDGSGASSPPPVKDPPAKDPPAKDPPAKDPPADPKKVPPPVTPPPSNDPLLRALEALINEIEGHRKQGLLEEGEGKQQRALKQYEAGMDKIGSAGPLAERLRSHPDEATRTRALELAKLLKELEIRFHLLMGQAYAADNQLRKATYHTNQVLVAEPENAQALELRDRITAEQMRRGNRKD